MTSLDLYHHVRGAGYRLTDPVTAARDLAFGRVIGLNSIRLTLDYLRSSPTYWEDLRGLIRQARAQEYTVQLVLLDAHDAAFTDPDALTAPETLAWVKEAVCALRGEEDILFWDLLNEPTALPALREAAGNAVPMADPAGYAACEAKLTEALRALLATVREADGDHPITVSHRFACDMELLGEMVEDICWRNAMRYFSFDL